MQAQSKSWILGAAAVIAAVLAFGVVVTVVDPSHAVAQAADVRTVAKLEDNSLRGTRLASGTTQTRALLAEINATSFGGPGYAIGAAVIGIVALFALNVFALAAWDRRRARPPAEKARARLDALLARRDELDAAIVEATRAWHSVCPAMHSVAYVERRRMPRRAADRETLTSAA
jgi:hypothetical protein